jgi:hypothetical protein
MIIISLTGQGAGMAADAIISVGELARVLSLSEQDSIAVLKAFLDQSYDNGGELHILSGFVAPVKTWERIEQQWLTELDKFGIKKGYHSKDCYHGNGEFENLDDPQRDTITKKLVRIITHTSPLTNIKRSDIYGVTIATPGLDFYEIMPAYGYPHPYGYLYQRAIRRIGRWTYEKNSAEQVSIITDRGEFPGTAGDVFSRVKEDERIDFRERACLLTTFPLSVQESPGLQASDLLAHRTLKHRLGRLDRGVIDAIKKDIRLESEMMDTEALLKTLDALPRFDWKEEANLLLRK